MRVWKRAGWIVAGCIAWLTGATPSRADVRVWKDGCPAYFPPEDAPAYTHDIKTHDGSAAFGASPEIDSPLAQTRVALEGWASTLHPEQGSSSIARELGARLVLQANLASGPMFGLIYAGYVADQFQGYDYHLGDLTLFAGYRHTGYLLGPLFRTGFAIRLAGGGPPTARTAASFANQREEVAINSPFRASSFGIEAPISGTLEYRIELVGCHAPFADLRVDVSRWRVNDSSDGVIDAPIELALGAYPLEGVALYVAFGEELRSSALRFRRITRATLGVELHLTRAQRVRVGLRVSAITGENVGGAEAGITVSLIAPWWKGTFE